MFAFIGLSAASRAACEVFISFRFGRICTFLCCWPLIAFHCYRAGPKTARQSRLKKKARGGLLMCRSTFGNWERIRARIFWHQLLRVAVR